MTQWELSAEERRQVFDQVIRPAVFGTQSPEDHPSFVILAGQAGSAASRARRRILAESGEGAVAVSAEDLRAFHPHYLELRHSQSGEALRLLAEPTATWLRASLSHARAARRSLLLVGTFPSPLAALGVADHFARDGFATRIVAAAVPRRASLLSAASRSLLDTRAGRPPAPTTVVAHDAGYVGTREIIERIEETASADRVTVIGADGTPRFDAEKPTAKGFEGALRAFDLERAAGMSSAESMRWLSELRAMTEYTLDADRIPQSVAEVLIELHQIALREVLPELDLPPDSHARPVAEERLARQLVQLRRAARDENSTVDVAAPVVTPPTPGRGISR